MCRWLHVSKSGFYEWRGRPLSATAQRREKLKEKIEQLFDECEQRYGYRRIHHELRNAGWDVTDELVRKLMRELGLVTCQPKPYRPTTTVTDADAPAIPDLVNRDFTATRPGEKLVGDITYIKTWEGWLYLCAVIDCHTKMVVGWSMAEHMKTSLVIDAMRAAAENMEIPEGAIFHSDRGTQYTSAEYRRYLQGQGIRSSMGRTGVCWDNALAESFWASLKNESLNRMVFNTRDKARREVVKYVEGFYNRRRIHSGLGYKTPMEVYTGYLNVQVAA
jgi:putative transposase